MFGCYRLILAFLVVVTHIGKIEVFAGLAVWAFFMLSGFLITGVLNSRYAFDGRGLLAFTISRALRLLPVYWISIAVALLLMHTFRTEVPPGLVNDAFTPPETFREWVSAMVVVGHTFFGLGRIEHAPSPAAWAIDVEIWLYVISCIWLSRSHRAARLGLVLSITVFPLLWLVSRIYLRTGDVDLASQLVYSFVPAALLPYSIGAFAWFHRDQNRIGPSVAMFTAAAAAVIVLALWVERLSIVLAYLLSLPVFACVMLSLARVRLRGALKTVDDICGHMSYPVYLAHWLGAYLVVVVATRWDFAGALVIYRPDAALAFTPAGFALIAATTAAIAFFIAVLLEVPMERVRHALAQQVRRKTKQDAAQHV